MPEITLEDLICMYIEVMGWVEEAENDDERQRLRELACDYLKQAEAAAERLSEELLAELPSDIQASLASPRDRQERNLSHDEAEAVRAAHAFEFVWPLEKLGYADLVFLADMFEGWSLDARLGSIDISRLHGSADNFRMLADLAGEAWKAPDSTGDTFLEFIAMMGRIE